MLETIERTRAQEYITCDAHVQDYFVHSPFPVFLDTAGFTATVVILTFCQRQNTSFLEAQRSTQIKVFPCKMRISCGIYSII